jgi:predicted RNA-binding Zn-ribbon protein involved in translation (DUF1610 family)
MMLKTVDKMGPVSGCAACLLCVSRLSEFYCANCGTVQFSFINVPA